MLSEVTMFLTISVSKIFLQNFRTLVTVRNYTVRNILLTFYVTEISLLGVLEKMFSSANKQPSTETL